MSSTHPMVMVPQAVVMPRGALWAAAVAMSVVDGLRWIRRHAHASAAPSPRVSG